MGEFHLLKTMPPFDSIPPVEAGSRFHSERAAGTPLSTTAMAHLFRGELARSDRWRTRLDTTTNWALTVSAAVLSVSFADPDTPHGVMLIGIWMVLTFLMIEARRYRYYDLWIHRVRLMEDGFWAPLLRGEPADPDALRELAHALSRPQLRLSLASAVGTRLNRVYGPMLAVLMVTWFAKVHRHPLPANTWRSFFENATFGPFPGALVFAVMVVFTVVLGLVLAASMVARQPLGELKARPRASPLALWRQLLRPYGAPSPRLRRPRRVQ